MSEQENSERIYGILQQLLSSVENLNDRVGVLETKDGITKPLWQEMRADQQQILGILQRQDIKINALEEKMEVGFRKLGDKFDHLALDYYDLHADVRDLQRRVTHLEPVN